MPQLIIDGQLAHNPWQPVDFAADSVSDDRIATLAQWQAAGAVSTMAVCLQPDDDLGPVLEALLALPMIAIHFPVFTDGRGFSKARKLRDAGFGGELRAVGEILPDQLHYLRRCGFNAFEIGDDANLESALACLSVFSDGYQGAIDQPLPLFRRRA
jgi:uncharacterized protein (DUF934 family)